MKRLLLTVALFAMTAHAGSAQAGTFKGKCNAQAMSAAIQKWANVPEPSEDLYYVPVSSEPVKPRSTTYIATVGMYDLNGYQNWVDYIVEMKDLKTCEVASISVKSDK